MLGLTTSCGGNDDDGDGYSGGDNGSDGCGGNDDGGGDDDDGDGYVDGGNGDDDGGGGEYDDGSFLAKKSGKCWLYKAYLRSNLQ